jgi:23S rRNA pseudouridine955/2504/2580 synthase
MSRNFKFKDWVIFEDDDYIVINKPPYLSTLEDRNDPANVLKLAKVYYAGAQVCHRLDKETSGALLIAKNSEAYRHAAIQFEKRTVTKIYHAITDGLHSFKREEVNLPIQIMANGPVRISHRDGKPASTILTTVVSYKAHTLVACEPLTGRMHQIRVHLAAMKAPITGDKSYGGLPFFLSSIKSKFKLKQGTEEEPVIKRVALHAFSIGFKNLNGDTIKVEAPYPKDIRVLVRQLERYP